MFEYERKVPLATMRRRLDNYKCHFMASLVFLKAHNENGASLSSYERKNLEIAKLRLRSSSWRASGR